MSRRQRFPWSAALAALAIVLPAAGAQHGGEPVLSVELRSDGALVGRDELEELVAVEAGQPLDSEELRRTLRNLHASGQAGEVEAYAQREADGLRIVFALWSPVLVDEIVLSGELGISERELRRQVPQRAGEALSESRVFRGVFQLQEHLEANGFLQAFVRVSAEVDEGRRTATVEYHVESGRPATLRAIEITGLPVEQSAGLQQLALGVGSRYAERWAREDAERLEAWLIDSGYRLAGVAEPVAVFDAATDEVDLVLSVAPGPLFEVEVLGGERDELRRRGLLPFLETERYDEALLLQSERRLRRHYQERGHYRVEVRTRTERTGERFRLVVEIEPGRTFELDRVSFTGNDSFGQDRLRALVATSPRLLLSGRLVDEVLQEDLANLRSFYLLQGFSQVEVGPPQVDESQGRLRVTIPIVEGPRSEVGRLRLHGVERASAAELLTTLPLATDGPYHPRLLERTLDAVKAFYEERGFADTQVSADVGWSEEGRAEVDLRVLEGTRLLVDRVIVRGNRRTEAELIRRTVDLAPSQPIDTRLLLDVQRRLYALGIFSEVEVRLAPASPFSDLRDVLVRVEEGANRRLTYGAGYDSEDGLRGLFGYSHGNLFGQGVSARFDARASDRRQQVRALVRQPYLAGWNLPVTYSLFAIDEEEETFTSLRRGLQAGIERLSERRELGLLATYKIVEIDDADPALERLTLDPLLSEVEIASLTPRLVLDRRDDPLVPSRGWSSSLQLEYAFPLAGADVEFFKLFTQNAGYLDLGRLGVLGASLRLGAIEPAGTPALSTVDPAAPEALASSEVPISERFFAGGRSSHRAYRRDELAIPCRSALFDRGSGQTEVVPLAECEALVAAGVPLSEIGRAVPFGGNGLALLNLDYRFPIAGAVGGTLFFDAGNVWADWRDLDPADAKLGAGVGLRYLSPIGPLRLEVGWKLDREAGEDASVIFLSFGNPF